jgi:subtilisin-like proprotein convertase family protein
MDAIGVLDTDSSNFDSCELPTSALDWSAEADEDRALWPRNPRLHAGALEQSASGGRSTFVSASAAISETSRIDWNGDWPAGDFRREYEPAAQEYAASGAPAHGDLAGPEASAAGGKGGGGGTKGGKGGGSTDGGSTGTGGDPVRAESGTTAITAKIGTITTLWQELTPPTGDAALPSDTYFKQQWGLTSKTVGINVATAWQNYTGKGINIAVIDDGVDYNHSDLIGHYLFGLDYDATNGGKDALGLSTDKHGTTVAGVIGGARDGTGIVGVAYDAGIAGFRISYSSGGPGQFADAFNQTLNNGVDLVNASWGYSTPYVDNFLTSVFATSAAAICDAAMFGRDGLGQNIVFSAGNNRSSGDNVNYHNYQNSPYVITVAATDSYGHVAAYSTPGAALLVSAPGTAKTDDRVGSAGYSTADYINMSGTSYSAPYVAGVVALMLEANPDLGYRDVQQILAYSAKNPDVASTSWQTNGAQDWNGGGLHFSHDFGFGLVDATAAVRLAESWQMQSTYANLSSITAVHTSNTKIPDGTGSLSSHIQLASSLTLDKIVVDLDITHAKPSDLIVTLISPAGTTATLVSNPANGTGAGITFEISANNFWGEDAKGDWTLTITDVVSGNSGILNGWTLEVLGDVGAPHVYVYTDEFATATGASRAILLDSSDAISINTAAVTTGSYLDLRPGAVDLIAGRALTIDAATIVKFAWGGDGNDTVIANDFGVTIQGGRGNDTITAGQGADILYGGPGSDTFVFAALGSPADTIRDFASGLDVIDFRPLFASLGYTGTDAVADQWLSVELDAEGSGVNFVIDAHDGAGPVTFVHLVGVALADLHQGADYFATPGV